MEEECSAEHSSIGAFQASTLVFIVCCLRYSFTLRLSLNNLLCVTHYRLPFHSTKFALLIEFYDFDTNLYYKVQNSFLL